MDPQISDTSSEEIDIDQLQQELNNALLKAEENLSGWKRAQADLENYRKRQEGEASELMQFGKQAAFVQILPILDSLEQALLHAPDPAEVNNGKYNNWKNGLEGIVKQIDAALAKMGIAKIEAVGKKFDPHIHEAVKEIPAEPDQEAGMVADQYQTGYTLNGQMLRPAQVVITKR